MGLVFRQAQNEIFSLFAKLFLFSISGKEKKLIPARLAGGHHRRMRRNRIKAIRPQITSFFMASMGLSRLMPAMEYIMERNTTRNTLPTATATADQGR